MWDARRGRGCASPQFPEAGGRGWAGLSTDLRLDAAPFPGQGASGGDSHLHAPQHSTAQGLGLQLPFGGLFCSDSTIFSPKFSLVFIHIPNPVLMYCSINDVHVKPQSSPSKTWTPYGSQCPMLPSSSFPSSDVVFGCQNKAQRHSQILNLFNNIMDPTSNKTLLSQQNLEERPTWIFSVSSLLLLPVLSQISF